MNRNQQYNNGDRVYSVFNEYGHVDSRYYLTLGTVLSRADYGYPDNGICYNVKLALDGSIRVFADYNLRLKIVKKPEYLK